MALYKMQAYKALVATIAKAENERLCNELIAAAKYWDDRRRHELDTNLFSVK